MTAEIRTQMQTLHDDIEALPIAQAMADGTIRPADYANLLIELFAIHTTLEEIADTHADKIPNITFGTSRSQCLQTDLAVLDYQLTAPALPQTRMFVRRLEDWDLNKPWSVLGAVFIIEGSRMGSMVLAKSMAQALQTVPARGHGLDYHVDGMDGLPGRWKQFKQEIDQWNLTPGQREDVINGAVLTMRGLYEIYKGVGDRAHESSASVGEEVCSVGP